ncbi:MAG TPA: helix-turn-helix transcriptional regulator [Thermoanaerobaculia bacterium]|nr:helix-turn-helix transcriptional regulator [Thermoanaerobaculia bacterium]
MPVFDGLGQALRWLREKEGLRQYETARAAGITKAMLSSYETGKQRPSLPSLEKILDALGADLMAVARALDHVNERRPRLPGPARGAGSAAPPPEVDVRAVLGVEDLPPEEEEAMARTLDGFHRLLRYIHRGGGQR